jgi:hypothetical protein
VKKNFAKFQMYLFQNGIIAGIKVNDDKTKIVVFSKGRLQRNIIFNYNGTNIEIVKDFNYLGIYFSRTGSFKVCKNHLSEKILKLCTK